MDVVNENLNTEPIRFKIKGFIAIGNSTMITIPKQYLEDNWIDRNKKYLAVLHEIKEVENGKEASITTD